MSATAAVQQRVEQEMKDVWQITNLCKKGGRKDGNQLLEGLGNKSNEF
jgi:hypothetical protein